MVTRWPEPVSATKLMPDKPVQRTVHSMVRSLVSEWFKSTASQHKARNPAILLGVGGINVKFHPEANTKDNLSKKHLDPSEVLLPGLFLKNVKSM
jgi:hypothetical protein